MFMPKQDIDALTRGRETPAYFAGGETSAGWRAGAVFKDVQVEGTLIMRRQDDGSIRVRLLGPMMGAVIVDAYLKNGLLKFDYILSDFNSNIIKSRLEKFVLILADAPGEVKKIKTFNDGLLEVYRRQADGTGKYFYQYDSAYPYALHNGSITVDYLDYREYKDTALPYNVVVKDSLSDITIELELLNIN